MHLWSGDAAGSVHTADMVSLKQITDRNTVTEHSSGFRTGPSKNRKGLNMPEGSDRPTADQ